MQDKTIEFHVAKGETCLGLFPLKEILKKVESGELSPTDYVFDEVHKDWVAIAAHQAFSAHQEVFQRLLEQQKNQRRASNPQLAAGQIQEPPSLGNGREAWFVLKGDHRFGPFDLLEIVRMLQMPASASPAGVVSAASGVRDQVVPKAPAQTLNDWDYVWTKRLKGWTRISRLKEFAPDMIEDLRQRLVNELGQQVDEIFFRRRYARARHEASILVHNHKQLLKGKSMEMGAGGLSLVLEAGELEVGQTVHLHMKPSRETPAFNTQCEIVSQRPMSRGDLKSTVVYGLRFLDVDEKLRDEIDVWANRKSHAGFEEGAA